MDKLLVISVISIAISFILGYKCRLKIKDSILAILTLTIIIVVVTIRYYIMIPLPPTVHDGQIHQSLMNDYFMHLFQWWVKTGVIACIILAVCGAFYIGEMIRYAAD
jgi:hypothetical protein